MSERVLGSSSSGVETAGDEEHSEAVVVEDGAGVVEVVIDGVFVSVERVQGGDLHARTEILAVVFEPVTVCLTGSSGNQVKQSGPGTPLGIWGQVNQPGQLFRAPPASFNGSGRDMMPDVLVRT